MSEAQREAMARSLLEAWLKQLLPQAQRVEIDLHAISSALQGDSQDRGTTQKPAEVCSIGAWTGLPARPTSTLTLWYRPETPCPPGSDTQPAARGLQVRLRAWASGWQLAEPVERGEALRAEKLRHIELDLLVVPDASLSSVQPGQRARVPLAGGHLLRVRDIATADAVLRGDTVNAVVRSDGLAVTRTATMLHDARIGERVQVRVGSAGRSVTARVVSAGEVEVMP